MESKPVHQLYLAIARGRFQASHFLLVNKEIAGNREVGELRKLTRSLSTMVDNSGYSSLTYLGLAFTHRLYPPGHLSSLLMGSAPTRPTYTKANPWGHVLYIFPK